MSLYIKDRIYQETATEGTGTLTLTNVKEGYQGFISLPNGSTTYYCITNNTDWEVGQGQYVNDGTNTLTRTLLSSSTKALLDLKGVSSVFCTYPAEKAVLLNFDGNIQLPASNVNFKNVTSNQVTSPAIITEAVIVDGTAGTEGDLATLLNVYTKDEVDDLHEKAEDLIEKEKIRNNNQDAEILSNRAIIADNSSEIVKIQDDYVKIQDDYLPLTAGAGHKMDGDIFMHENKVVGLGDPTNNTDATNKFYVDMATNKVSLYVKEATRKSGSVVGDNEFIPNNSNAGGTTEFFIKNAFMSDASKMNVKDYTVTNTSKITLYQQEYGREVYTGLIKKIEDGGDYAKLTVNPLLIKYTPPWVSTAKAYAFIIEDVIYKT